MKHAMPVLLVALALAGDLTAAEMVSDDFSFGPGVKGREETQAGAYLGGQTTTVGDARWETPVGGKQNVRRGGLNFRFTDENGGDDRGLVTYDHQRVVSGYFQYDFPTDDRTVVASVEFLANGSFPRGGGFWIGFTADSPSSLDLIETAADHVALRFHPGAGKRGGGLSYKCCVGGTLAQNAGESSLSEWAPDQVTRLTLTYNPKTRQFTGKVELPGRPDVSPLEIAGALESDVIFNHVQFDMTGQDAASTEIKKAALRKIEVGIRK